MSSDCIVSVIIPTYKSTAYLDAALSTVTEALCRVADASETIVVDTTPEGTAEQQATEAICSRYEASYINGSWRSVSRSRNAGAKAAKGKYLYFIDSDCKAMPDTIAIHLQAMTDTGPEHAGSIGCTLLEEPLGLPGNAIAATPFTIAFSWASFLPNPPWGATCNLMVRAEAFRACGGFDEEFFSVVGGEDVDFGWRVLDKGWKWLASPRAVVVHDREPWNTWRSNCLRVYRYGIGDHYLLRKHPQRTFAEPLRYPALVCLAVFASVGLFSAGMSYAVVLLPVIAGFLACVTHGVRTYIARRRTRGLLPCLLSELYIATFDVGYLLSAMRRCDLKGMVCRARHAPQQVADSRLRMVINVAALGFALVLVFLIGRV